MNKSISVAFVVVLILASSAVNAAPTFQTGNQTLEHARYYSWNLSYDLKPNEQVTGAVLTYHNIINWAPQANDRVFSTLMDDWGKDGKDKDATDRFLWFPGTPATNAWAGQGELIGTYNPDWFKPATVVYDLGKLGLLDELNGYAQDGKFAIGIDPDCFYTVRNITLDLVKQAATQPIPAPGSIMLGSLGVCLAGWLRRRRGL